MYTLGVVVLVALSALVAGGLTRRRALPAAETWDIPKVATTFMPIVGALAGFSIASTIFLANLNLVRESAEFPSLIGMFVIAFVTFVATGQEFGMTPSLTPAPHPHYAKLQRLSYLIAMSGYFVALTVSWSALQLLLVAIGLAAIADVFRWVLLVVVLAGATRLATQHVYLLTTVARASCAAVPAIACAGAAIFRLGVVPATGLAIPANEPFVVSVACFAVAALGFGLQSLALALHDHASAWRLVSAHWERGIVVYLQAVTVAVALLWLTVA